MLKKPLTQDQVDTLLEKAQNEDTQAVELLIRHLVPTAMKISHMYNSRAETIDDLESYALEGLAIAIRKFDPVFGASLNTYASYWVKAKILKALGDNKLDATEYNDELGGATKEPEETKDVDLSKLTEREQLVIKLRFTDKMGLKEIGAELSVCKQRVREIIKRALEKVRI